MADQKLTPAQAIFQEAQQARKASQKLEPLLQLLDTPEGAASPIEQLQEVLETLLTGQRLLHQSMLELHQKVDADASKRRG